MMWSSAREIAAGDVIIVWLTRDLVQPLVVTPGCDFNSKFGNYRHSDLVGIPYGSKVASRTGKGFIHVLRPTPELWTLALPHRTQILYLADIAFVVSYLNIKPGSRVIEAGTGSGSFSHSVARTIGPSGHLWSYEFHEVRARKAREEFKRHGMDDIVTLTHRNVCKDGFTIIDTVDSVFLDLPAPWDAVEHAKKALRKDRQTRICCFSPCMEQVLRTVSALNEAGFTEITMYETLLRPHDVSSVPALQTIGEISEKLKQSERRREDKRLRQIAANQAIAAKRKREEQEVEQQGEGKAAEEPGESVESKRVRIDEDEGPTDEGETGPRPMEVDLVELPASPTPASAAEAAESKSAPVPVPTSASTTVAMSTARSTPMLPPSDRISVSKVFPEVRGHTSYLTFASLVPFAPASPASSELTLENGDAHVQGAHAATGPLAS